MTAIEWQMSQGLGFTEASQLSLARLEIPDNEQGCLSQAGSIRREWVLSAGCFSAL